MKYEALIVEPRSKQRLLLKNALGSLPTIANTRTCSGPEELGGFVGLARANTVTFISDTIPVEEIIAILRASASGGKEHGITLIISSRHELPRRFVSRLLLQGAHGFVIEPFSVFDLDSAINTALAFSRLAHSARVGRLLPMLIEDSFILVDEIAAAFYTGTETEPLLTELEDILDIANSEAERHALPLYRFIEVERFAPEDSGREVEAVANPEANPPQPPLVPPPSPNVRRTTIRRS